jgi:hypothetical protein
VSEYHSLAPSELAQLYDGEKKLCFDEMMMMFILF